MRVKVCGIRRVEDAVLAAKLGADAIGLLVGQRHRSEDFLAPTQAREIAEQCPPLVTVVLVTHLEDASEIVALAQHLGVSTIQVHSDCNATGLNLVRRRLPGSRIIRAVHATGETAIEEMRQLENAVDAFVVDSINVAEDRVGGTGLTHDWQLSRRAVREIQRPIILAGGLKPDNVALAVRTVQPYAVDANTGLRNADGFKSEDKLRSFVVEAKRAFFEIAGDGARDGARSRDDQ